MKSITNELISVSQTLSTEKGTRETSEKQIFDMLKDIHDKVKVQLQAEHRSREEV